MDKDIRWPGWETVRLIGRGSFGAVYEIQREIFGEVEKAALKVISIPQNEGDIEELYSEGYDEESITSTFQSHLKSIVAEYSMMRKMSGCVNIVSCDDVQCVRHDDGIGWDIFIKMELLTPLLKVSSDDISEETVVKIAKDICNALIVCKKHDIVHRDIKPQNIFVSEYGDYKLGDFGIAKTVEKTMGGTKIGTYKYMAPEVYNNQPYGSSADIYSLGLVLYWLLNERRMPFLPLPPAKLSAGMDEKARIRRLSGEVLPSPAHGCKELKAIVLKACAYDPKERYQSATEMLEELCALGGVSADKGEVILDEPTIDVAEEKVDGREELLETPKDTEDSQPDVEPEEKEEVTVSAWEMLYAKQESAPKEEENAKIQEEKTAEENDKLNTAEQQETKNITESAESQNNQNVKWMFLLIVVGVILLVIFGSKSFSHPENGWWISGGNHYFYSNDKCVKGLREIDGDIYYFNEDGKMITGLFYFKDVRCYFGEDGKMQPHGSFPPDLAGMPLEAARKIFEGMGLVVEVKYLNEQERNNPVVFGQDKVNVTCPKGTTITLFVQGN